MKKPRFTVTFERVMDYFKLPAENRRVAWNSCFTDQHNKRLDARAVAIYTRIAKSL